MRKSLLVISSFSLIAITACNPSKKPEQKLELPLLKSKSINLSFPKNDPLGNPNNSTVDLSRYFYKLSKYKKYSYSSMDKIVVGLEYYDGITVSKNDSGYTLKYIHSDKKVNRKAFSNTSSFYFNQKVEGKVLTISYPTSYDVDAQTKGFVFKVRPMDKPENLIKDTTRIFNGLLNKPIQFTKKLEVKGEVNSAFPDKSIYANFERNLAKYYRSNAEISDVKKKNTFKFNYKDKTYPLYLQVFPYRKGTKLTYVIDVEYSYDSSGKESLNKSDLKTIHEKIELIVNS